MLQRNKPYEHVQLSVIDCRYPYEYEGGHIQGSLNLYTPDAVKAHFMQRSTENRSDCTRNIIVFHCEFSSERGPKL